MNDKSLVHLNYAIAIANSVWVIGIISLIIFKEEASLWLLALPIIFNWSFKGYENKE